MSRLPEYDPLAVPASREDINRWRRERESAPLLVNGVLLDVDRDSLERMGLRLDHWQLIGEAGVPWVTAENHRVWWGREDLRSMYTLAVQKKAQRSADLHTATQRFKSQGATLRQLKDWTP